MSLGNRKIWNNPHRNKEKNDEFSSFVVEKKVNYMSLKVLRKENLFFLNNLHKIATICTYASWTRTLRFSIALCNTSMGTRWPLGSFFFRSEPVSSKFWTHKLMGRDHGVQNFNDVEIPCGHQSDSHHSCLHGKCT